MTKDNVALFSPRGALPSPGSVYLSLKNNPINSAGPLLAELRALVEPSREEHRILSNGLNESEGEHELFWQSSTVIWSVGGVQKRKWTFQDEKQSVSAACFAWLEGSKFSTDLLNSGKRLSSHKYSSKASHPSDKDPTFGPFTHLHYGPTPNPSADDNGSQNHIRVICIFLRDVGRFYSLDGLEFTINLPFVIHRVWEILPVGVLLQAALTKADEVEVRARGTTMMPSLYSLSNPFDEPRAVVFASEISGGFQCARPGRPLIGPNPHIVRDGNQVPMIKWDDKILYVSPNNTVSPTSPDRLIVTIESATKTLRIFRYVYVKRNDRPGPLKTNPRRASFDPSAASMTIAAEQNLSNATGDRIDHLLGSSDLPTLGKKPNSELNDFLRAADSNGNPSRRRRSQSRTDLSITLDRMAIGGTGADELGATNETGRKRMKQVSAEGPPPYANNKKIKGEIFLEKLWECPVGEDDLLDPGRISVAIFDTRLTHACVAVVISAPEPTLHVLRLEPKGDRLVAVHLQSLPAVCAVPVQATRSGASRDGVKDLLCLREDGSMFLLCPGGLLDVSVSFGRGASDGNSANTTSATLAPRPESSHRDEAVGSSRKAIHLTDSVRSCVTVIYSDNSVLRTSTDLTPHSPFVQTCFVTLSHTCPSSLLWDIRVKYLLRWGKLGRSGNGAEEFQCFSNAIMEILSFAEDSWLIDKTEADAWSLMALHETHERLSNDTALRHLHLPSFDERPQVLPRAHLPEIAPLLHGLHLLGEELRMDHLQQKQLALLAPLLVKLAPLVGADWADYWLRVYPDAADVWELSSSINLVSPLAPPDLTGFLYASAGALSQSHTYVGLTSVPRIYNITPSLEYGSNTPLTMTENLLEIYAAMKDAPVLDHTTTRERAQKTVLRMLERDMSLSDLERLPFGIAAPLREALRTCQNAPPSDWSVKAYQLIGRNDMAKMVHGELTQDISFEDAYKRLNALEFDPPRESMDNVAEQSRVLTSVRHLGSMDLDPSRLDFASIRFSEDQRLKEVESILDSSRVQTVKVPERPDLSEHDLAKELAATVHHIVERTFALSFGRAMFTFGSLSRLTRDEYVVPPLDLHVKFVPHNVTYPPDPTKIPAEATQWAEFHNGVAAALRLNPSAQGIDSSWIAFNKPTELNAEHAGYLLGLGLTGHLRNMWNWHGYRYLVPKHEPTSIAILLGLGAAHIGSGDSDITRLLTIHMRPLLPPDSAELGIPLGAQSASLMGIGLLYLGTTDRGMAEVALDEMSASQQVGGAEISNEHKEAYTITAALAFGMIMCGRGATANSPSDVVNVTRLRAFLDGKEPVDVGKNKATAGAPIDVNLNFVAPAATIALALMFMKTNRSDIAAAFALPPDPAGLRDVQPSLLLLRALGRSLIMWDDITPSVSWVLSQAQRAPKDLTQRQIQDGVKDLYEYAFFNILSGACLAIGLKYAGTATTAANHVLIHFHDKLLENLRKQPTGQSFDLQLRRSAIREAINMVDLSLGIVMAGTGDVACMQRFRVRHGLFGPQFKYGAHIATHMAMGFLFLGGGRYTLGTSNAAIACLIVSLYPRFPLHSSETRGLLQAFRHLWVLAVEPRCLIARDADSNEIARIPIKIKIQEGSEDPRTHHFVCPTLLPDFNRFVSLKVDSPRYWPFVLDVADYSRNKESILRTQTIFVKRRTGFLAYANDPLGFQSLSIWNGTPIGNPSILDFPHQITLEALSPTDGTAVAPLPRSFDDMRHFTSHSTHDIGLLAFADRFCRLPGKTPAESTTVGFSQQALLEVLSGDKPQILSSLLSLYHSRITLPNASSLSILRLRDVYHANEFYAVLFRLHGGLIDATQRPPLMRVTALQATVALLSTEADNLRVSPNFMTYYRAYVRGERIACSPEEDVWTHRSRKRQLSFFLLHERVPSAQTLAALRRLASEAVLKHRSTLGGSMDPLSKTEWETLRNGLALVLQKTALSLSGPRTPLWSLRSIYEVLDFWNTE